MISRIGARAYRCFALLDISLPRYSVIAGANGIGKSTLLDIPVLLGDMLGVGVQRAFLERIRPGHGARAEALRGVLHRGRGSDCILVIEAVLPGPVRDLLRGILPARVKDTPPTHLRYELRLRLLDATVLVVEAEFLDLFPESARASDLARPPDPQGVGWRPVIERQPGAPPLIQAEYRRGQIAPDDISPDQLAFSQLRDDVLFPAATWLAGLLGQGAMSYAPDYAKLREAQPPGPSVGLQRDATDLPWRVLQLQRTAPDRLEEWVHIVRLALPNVLGIEAVERDDDHHAYLRLTYKFGDAAAPDHQVTSSGLSDGTMRILAFSILPFLDQLPPLLTIEQPEDGIHPRAVDVVLESLSALPDTQVLVSTQSPVVLARTPLEQLICLRRDDEGGAAAVSGPAHPRLQEWHQEIDLGTLFAAGVLA